MKTLTITRASLQVALLTWAIDARKGETLTHADADADAKPVHEVAEESAAHLWALLEQGAGAAQTGSTKYGVPR